MVSLERFLSAGRDTAWALKDHDSHTSGHASSYGGVDATATPRQQVSGMDADDNSSHNDFHEDLRGHRCWLV